MSSLKADQRPATQNKAETLVAASLAVFRRRHGEVSPEPSRFLRPRMVTAPVVMRSVPDVAIRLAHTGAAAS